MTALTLAAAAAVPAALWPGAAPGDRMIRGAAAGAFFAAPTDQIRAREWHLTSIRASRAWKYSEGANVTVAVLDTGVDGRHPDLTGRVVAGPDLTGGKRAPGSRYWGQHGTSMASIIAGHGDGAGGRRGVLGVAPRSRILSIRVTWENDDPVRKAGRSGLSRDTVAQGIRYAVDHGAQVVNMSLGGGQLYANGSAAEEAAIRYALGKGVVLIASAGNDGAAGNRRTFPAAYPGVIAVGALDRHGRLWKDSNRHAYVGVCAPGVDIVSASPGGGYVVGSGTSPSSAIVAGVAALVRSRYPKLTPEQIRTALVQGSPARAGQPTGSTTCKGPLDAARALAVAARLNRASGGTVATPAPAPSPVAEAAPKGSSSGGLVRAILVGGAVLVLVGLILGWRQRRRPDDEETATTDPAPASAAPGHPNPAAPAPAHPGPAPAEPATIPSPTASDRPTPGAKPRPAQHDHPASGAPLNPAQQDHPAPGVIPGPTRPAPGAPSSPAQHSHPVPGAIPDPAAPARPTPDAAEPARSASQDAPAPPSGRPTRPAPVPEPAEADDPELSDEDLMFDDDEWERFRRSALEEPFHTGMTGPLPRVAPAPSEPPPAPEHPAPVPRKAPPPDEDDYRPPWW
ncbi:S8 family serine peptidase [Actinomadura atramentaria]|uniref:S8 family serine peptidase n=1 Tax=Actinomadura atramentaria TaxID=1990 RepID=UPI000362D92B|nr:S8 family serine peptidase [Actinomadura atramentaria]